MGSDDDSDDHGTDDRGPHTGRLRVERQPIGDEAQATITEGRPGVHQDVGEENDQDQEGRRQEDQQECLEGDGLPVRTATADRTFDLFGGCPAGAERL